MQAASACAGEPDAAQGESGRGGFSAFQTYRRAGRGGEFLDTPLDPQHPAEDLLDALRGGIRDALPDGRKPAPNLRTVSARQFF
jgi:hypothetical protein